MSSSRAKKVKMATKSCPECDQQVPVACKSCPCGYIFISRKLLHAKRAERSPPITENKSEAKRRRTERVKREKINSAVNKDLENRKRSRSNSHSDQSRRGRGRPKSASAKKHEEERAYLLLCSTNPAGNTPLVVAVRGAASSVPPRLDLTSLRS
ncbi:UPF0547 protein C16orf87 homolog isoform X2 [Camarhynchus parvulus]|uniref:UPF0547 protein C16orf87 homolog isoform X2 n=1 Tax=Geospiza parvula TaxID=87175 RepID=UPI0012383B19|nr:UPF0547 protein C16orf87 homolog isoform X2 [Camarhynchus parvulus]